VRLAVQHRAAIVIDVPESESIQELKESEKYPAGRKALLDFGRLRRLIKKLAEWHGMPCIEARLYSTVCPECRAKMLELQNRHVKCTSCGLEAHRDNVPIMWAQKRFDELLELAKYQLPSFPAPCRMLIYPPASLPSWRGAPRRARGQPGAADMPLGCVIVAPVRFGQAEGGGTASPAAAPPREP
jgi:putative transposase